MIFTGDIASPSIIHTRKLANTFRKFPEVFLGKTLVCNFEGLICKVIAEKNEPVLSNHPEVISVLAERGSVVAALANNHTLDMPVHYEETINIFQKQGVCYTGAGKTPKETAAPAVFYENGRKVIMFNACWDFLLYNHKNPSNGVYVEEIDEEKLIAQAANSRHKDPDALIVVFLHWNFDLETLPFPMHRGFSKDLIDAGADLVAGHHSHCVQGGEKYKNGYIVYGLGNFFIPHGVFANGKLKYPEIAKTELVLEWDTLNKKMLCHWFEYKHSGDQHELTLIESSNFESCLRLESYSPFRTMSDIEYLSYFKKHRRKRNLIPVYSSYKNKKRNSLFTSFLRVRASFARFLAKQNIIKWA